MEAKKRSRSITERLSKSANSIEAKQATMANWAANIDSRTRELLALISLSSRSGDSANVDDLCHELGVLIHRSMSAIPRITDILINTEPEREQ